MDHEHADELVQSTRPANRSEETEQPAPLPSQIGNAAFTRLVQGASPGTSVSRETAKTQGAGPLDPEIADEIDAARGGGQPLDEEVQADMEGTLGADLSGVRVHTDAGADHLNRSVQAEAFTTGSDVFFKSGTYEPDSSDGRGLLAHELTHVVQQAEGRTPGGSTVSDPSDPHEVEAKSVGDAVASSSPAPQAGVARQEEEEEMMMSVDRQEEEEEMMMSVDRQEEEEEMMMSVDRQEEPEEEEMMMSVDRQEEEEEMMMSVDRQEVPEEEEEEAQA